MQTEALHIHLQDRKLAWTLKLKEQSIKTADFAKRSFRQDVRTNQKGNENGGAQAGKRSCRAWRFGREPSTLGKDMNIQKRGKVMTTAKENEVTPMKTEKERKK